MHARSVTVEQAVLAVQQCKGGRPDNAAGVGDEVVVEQQQQQQQVLTGCTKSTGSATACHHL